MTTPTGPMDPERLASARAVIGQVKADCPSTPVFPWEIAAELLDDRDHWHGEAMSLRADAGDEIARLHDRITALSESRDSRLDPLRKALLTLARAVIDGDGLSAKTLAADVLDDHGRGEL